MSFLYIKNVDKQYFTINYYMWNIKEINAICGYKRIMLYLDKTTFIIEKTDINIVRRIKTVENSTFTEDDIKLLLIELEKD